MIEQTVRHILHALTSPVIIAVVMAVMVRVVG